MPVSAFLRSAVRVQRQSLRGMPVIARHSPYPVRGSASGLTVRQLASRANVDPFVAEHVRSKPHEPLPAECVLKLSPDEKELLDLLEHVVTERKLQTTVRIAGGWVRDKLLHMGEKKDVDIAVDDMTGVKFAKVLNNWAIKRLGKPFRTGVIATNPEKSKHLETANMLIGEFSVDFVNLRAEQYDNTSRVPKIRTAAAAEDAERRDLTINSLFYNLRTKQIEDLTGLGLKDLCDGVIRTPLEPTATLLDDPLRLLRSVRFACRFGYVFDEKLYNACFRDDVKVALRDKISAERMAIELQHMLAGNSSVRAISALRHFNVLPTVLGMPQPQHIKPFGDIAAQKYMLPFRHKPRFFQHDSSSLCDQAAETYLAFGEWWSQARGALSQSPRHDQLQSWIDTLHGDAAAATDAATLGLSVLTFPAAAFEYDYLTNKRRITLPECLILHGMRRSSSVASAVTITHATAIRLIDYLLRQDLDALAAAFDVDEATVQEELRRTPSVEGLAPADIANISASVGAIRRVDLAMLALKSRGLFVAGLTCALTWLLVHQGAAKVDPLKSQPAAQVDDAEVLGSSVEIVDNQKYQQIVAATLAVYRAFKLLELDDVHTLKPLLDGGKVQKIIPKVPVGPALGDVMDLQLQLQAARRDTTQEEMATFLKAAYPAYCS